MLTSNLKSYLFRFLHDICSASELDDIMSTTPINLPIDGSDEDEW